MSTPGGYLIPVHVGHGLLIRQSGCQVMADSTVCMPSNGLFDSLDAINGVDCLNMSCGIDRCIGLLVVCLQGIQLRRLCPMLWYVMVRRAHSLAVGTAPVQCSWQSCLLQLPPRHRRGRVEHGV